MYLWAARVDRRSILGRGGWAGIVFRVMLLACLIPTVKRNRLLLIFALYFFLIGLAFYFLF